MENDQLSRKLTVILHADVVSSTMPEQNDETLAHERAKALAQLARITGLNELLGTHPL